MNKVTLVDFNELDSLNNRDPVRAAFKNAYDSKAVWVDFARIDFLSRTAAHEILTIKKTLNARNIDISFTNLNEQVNEMLALVQNSSPQQKNVNFRFVKWLSFKNEEQYRDYLLKL